MKLQISTDEIPLQGTVENYIEKHLNKDLEKYMRIYNDDTVANIRVKKGSRWGFKITFDMQIPGHHIFSEEKHEDFNKCVLIVRDEVKRQLNKAKEKREY